MRPILLEFTAFGPYPGKNSVNFDEIDGLFLITGNTGAGKTTILDALTFAVYGALSGEDRPLESIRCAIANKKDQTKVYLKFEHGGHIYEVERTYRLDIASKSKQAELTGDDGTKFSQWTNVNDEMKKLVGIDVKKWRLIVTIPQGKFAELIKADSKEKAEIIKTIFGTVSFGKYVDEMKKRYKIAENDAASLAQIIKTEVAHIECDEGSTLFMKKDECEKCGNDIAAMDLMDDILSALSSQNNEDGKKIESIDSKEIELKEARNVALNNYHSSKAIAEKYKELENLENEKASLESNKEEIDVQKTISKNGWNALNTVSPIYTTLEKTNNEISELRKNLTKDNKELEDQKHKKDVAMSSLESAKSNRCNLNEVDKQISHIEDRIGEYEKLGKQAELVKKTTSNYQNAESDLNNSIEDKKQLSSELEEIRCYLEKNAECKDLLSSVKNDIKKSDDLLSNYNNYKSKAEAYQKAISDQVSAQKNFEKAFSEYYKVKSECDETEERYFSSYLGILAEGLHDGVKCPLCGSTDHPNKAIKPTLSATEKEWKSSKQKLDDYNKKLESSSKTKTDADNKIESTKNNLEEKAKELDIAPDFDNCIIQANELILSEKKNNQELNDRKNELEHLTEEYNSKTKKQNEIVSKLNEIELKIDQKRSACNDAKVALTKAETTLKELKNTLDFETKEEAEKTLDSLRKQVSDADKLIDDANKNLRVVENNITSLEAEIKNLNDTLTKKSNDEREHSSSFKKALSECGFGSIDEYKSSCKSNSDLQSIDEIIKKFDDRVISVDSRIGEKKKEIDGQENPNDLDELKIKYDETEHELSEFLKSTSTIRNRYKNNCNAIELLRKKLLSYKTKTKESDTLRTMYEVASGQVTGRPKISFDEYVQCKFFYNILGTANQWFERITSGRYSLSTGIDSGKEVKNDPLELDVFDNETGGSRNVKSLSGGESFMAALCLALGMSDTIQNFAGGKSLDALFIDEGFGTLDKNCMKEAIDILVSISGDNNALGNRKCIGIISHREELKEVIPKRIEIVHTEKGSIIEKNY